MQMRFTLQTRLTAAERWTAVEAPGFGVWTTSAPGTLALRLHQARREPAGARRLPRGRALPLARRLRQDAETRCATSRPPCQQPDPRPNLVVRGIGVEAAADPARRRYVVLVRNNGRAPAGASSLALTVGGEPQPDGRRPAAGGRRGHARHARGPGLPAGHASSAPRRTPTTRSTSATRSTTCSRGTARARPAELSAARPRRGSRPARSPPPAARPRTRSARRRR